MEESVQVAIKIEDLETIRSAQKVTVDVCGQSHPLEDIAHEAFREFLRNFKKAKPQTPSNEPSIDDD